jgi:hypothetical protein
VQRLLMDDWEPGIRALTQGQGWAVMGQAIGDHVQATGQTTVSVTISTATEQAKIPGISREATRWTLTAIVKPPGREP